MELQAKELRIGNVINFLGQEAIVECISNIDERPDMYWIQTKGRIPHKIFQFRSIELTEDWLSLMGMTKDRFENADFTESVYWCIKDSDDSFYVDYDIDYEGWYVGVNGYGYIRKVPFVHNLQNLYFALTGQELTIKDK